MLNGDLHTGILGLTVAYTELSEVYIDNLSIGDNASTKKQKEILRALYIYIQVLNYYHLGDNIDEATAKTINFLLSESMRMVNTFKNSYYGKHN